MQVLIWLVAELVGSAKEGHSGNEVRGTAPYACHATAPSGQTHANYKQRLISAARVTAGRSPTASGRSLTWYGAVAMKRQTIFFANLSGPTKRCKGKRKLLALGVVL